VQADRAAAQLSSDSGLTVVLDHYLRSDGVLLWPGAPTLIGTKDVLQFTAPLQRSPRLRLSWQSLGIEMSQDSALAALWGIALATGSRDTFPPRLGRIVTVWQRGTNRWELAVMLLVGAALSENKSAVSVHGSNQAPSSAPSDPSKVYLDADRSFAQLARDSGASVAFRTWAAPDVMTFGGAGLLVRGREDLSQAVAGPEQWDWHPVAGGSSGDLGWTAGEATIRGGGSTNYSKYLTIWRRSPGKPPRFIIDAGNPRPGP